MGLPSWPTFIVCRGSSHIFYVEAAPMKFTAVAIAALQPVRPRRRKRAQKGLPSRRQSRILGINGGDMLLSREIYEASDATCYSASPKDQSTGNAAFPTAVVPKERAQHLLLRTSSSGEHPTPPLLHATETRDRCQASSPPNLAQQPKSGAEYICDDLARSLSLVRQRSVGTPSP